MTLEKVEKAGEWQVNGHYVQQRIHANVCNLVGAANVCGHDMGFAQTRLCHMCVIYVRGTWKDAENGRARDSTLESTRRA